MTEEARLIAKAARGDRDAFESLVRSRQERVFWTAFQVVGDEEDARDVAQQVFIRLWKVLPRYRPRWRFDPWLYRITVNLAIDAYRRRQSRPEVPRTEGFEAEPPSTPRAVGDSVPQAEIQRIFLRLARRLSGQQRAVFVLKEMNGLGNREIAKVMELSESTVRNHLHQARKVLRRGLEALYPEYLPGGKPGGEGER
jgi:RNA polymerase sigma-70 factor (ECF subfamily)